MFVCDVVIVNFVLFSIRLMFVYVGNKYNFCCSFSSKEMFTVTVCVFDVIYVNM